MNWALAGAGLAATLMALVGRLYLRIRIRQLKLAAQTEREFREAALALLKINIPNEAREHIAELAVAVGTGKLADGLGGHRRSGVTCPQGRSRRTPKGMD
jgi:hypothetical protein